MIGLSRATFQLPAPDRAVAPRAGFTARVTFSGRRRPFVNGEVKTITGLVVTNNSPISAWVEIENEATKQSFSAMIPAGQTVVVQTTALATYWNAQKRIPGWDGINIRWREPA